MSTDSPHALRVEVARLAKERDEAREQEIYWHNRATEAREACAAANAELAIWRNEDAREAKYEAVSQRCTAAENALAAARRECEGLRAALHIAETALDSAGGRFDSLKTVRAALAAPASASIADKLDEIEADAYVRDMGDRE